MEIEVLGISASPIKGGNTETFLQEALKEIEKMPQAKVSFLSLAGKEIKDCIHCNFCLKSQEEGKFCSIKDDMDMVYPQMLKADALLLATPVYVTRLSGYLACLLDRCRVFVHGNYYRGKLQDKVGGGLAVLWARHCGAETTLVSILQSFLVFGMHPVGPGALGGVFGAVGLSSLHGTGKFDPKDKLGVLKDEYGLQSARLLAKKVVETTRLIKAGKEALLTLLRQS